jgi:hypothetical protein
METQSWFQVSPNLNIKECLYIKILKNHYCSLYQHEDSSIVWCISHAVNYVRQWNEVKCLTELRFILTRVHVNGRPGILLTNNRFIQYIPTYIGLLSQFTIHMYSDVFSHNSLFAIVYLSTSFDLKYRSLWGQCTRTWMHIETKDQSTKCPVPLYWMFSDRYNRPDYLAYSRLEHRTSNLIDTNPSYKTNQPPSNDVDKTVSLKSNIIGIPLYRSVHLTRYHDAWIQSTKCCL